MKQNLLGGFVVVLLVSFLALGCGVVCGINHVGENYCKQILPTSLTSPLDTINCIHEDNFVANNITVQLNIPKTIVSTTPKTNYTNNSNNTTTNNTYTGNHTYNSTNSNI